MNSIFSHYTKGSGKQKVYAYNISQNIVNGEDTLKQDDYNMLNELIHDALVKCVMVEYMERVKRCEMDRIGQERFKRSVNEVIAIIRQALQQKTAKGKRSALINLVKDPSVIINFRHSYSTLDWAQITFIYLLNERLRLNIQADNYRIRVCRA